MSVPRIRQGPQCAAMIPNQFYHMTEYPGTTEHRCPFDATIGPYCIRHDPARRLNVLINRANTLEAKRLSVLQEIEAHRRKYNIT